MIIRMWAILTFILQLSLPSFAISWKVIGACSAQAIEEGAVEIDLKKSVFDVTRFIFDKNAIPYEVDLNDFSSILSSPSGEAAVEILDKKFCCFEQCPDFRNVFLFLNHLCYFLYLYFTLTSFVFKTVRCAHLVFWLY